MFYQSIIAAAWRIVVPGLIWLCLPVSAQQAIQFSTPVEEPANQEISLASKPDHKVPSDFNAPKPLFRVGPPASFNLLPSGPVPVIVTPRNQQWQKNQDAMRNWTLLTPEQILGVPTPESILGLADPQEDPNQSLEERFLKRRERQSEAGTEATNIWQPVMRSKDGLRAGQLEDSQTATLFTESLELSTSDSTRLGGTRDFKQLFSQDPIAPGNSRADSLWSSPFGSPEAPAKATPEQLAGMERFRALFMEHTVQEKPATVYAGQATATPDADFQGQPAFNPAGRSFIALDKNIARPVGLTPLPGITGPAPTPVKKPSSVQPPPWMSSTAEHASLPQRQF
jgi:hypothetical protein